MTATLFETTLSLFMNEHSTNSANLKNDRASTVLRVLICIMHLTVCSYHITYHYGVNPHSVVSSMSKNSLLETGAISELLDRLRPYNHLFVNTQPII